MKKEVPVRTVTRLSAGILSELGWYRVDLVPLQGCGLFCVYMNMEGKLIMIEELNAILKDGLAAIEKATDLDELESIRIAYFGKNGRFPKAMKGMSTLSDEEKPEVGKLSNKVKTELNGGLDAKQTVFNQQLLNEQLYKEKIDVTLPGRNVAQGNSHILTQIREDIEDLFIGMGYVVENGFEVEEDDYNFTRMNLAKNHPARDMQDTFYINSDILLRTHTSPVQARVMENHDFTKGPLKMISPGKVYRRDTDDATHSHQFQQIEGLVIGEKISLADLRGTLEVFIRDMFGEDREVRFRPSYFPFTEPSAEADVSCFNCGGKGCSVCKQSGWIEILGSGVVHPDVLEMSGIDSTQYSGFAFGVGVERVAMLKYGINDIRDFYLNDQRFLKQFNTRG